MTLFDLVSQALGRAVDEGRAVGGWHDFRQLRNGIVTPNVEANCCFLLTLFLEVGMFSSGLEGICTAIVQVTYAGLCAITQVLMKDFDW